MSEPYNAAERRHVREAAKASRAAGLAARDVVLQLMGTTSGRAWVYSLLEGCHIFASSFGTNALSMAFAEGERNVGLQILSQLMDFCPDLYMLMIQEKNTRDRAAESARREPTEPESVSDFESAPE